MGNINSMLILYTQIEETDHHIMQLRDFTQPVNPYTRCMVLWKNHHVPGVTPLRLCKNSRCRHPHWKLETHFSLQLQLLHLIAQLSHLALMPVDCDVKN